MKKAAIQWLNFNWCNLVFNGRKLSKAGINLPVSVNFMPGDHIMQFDLGAPVTVFYSSAIPAPIAKELIKVNEGKKINGSEVRRIKNKINITVDQKFHFRGDNFRFLYDKTVFCRRNNS